MRSVTSRPLRRLMRNCGPHGRSRNLMLVPNLRPKVVPHGPRLLPRLIVRTRGRLVAGAPSLLCAQEARPSGPALRPRGHHPGHTRPVAPLPQREGLLALRRRAPAPLLPEAVHPEPVQPQGASPGARVARSAAGPRRADRRAFGRLPRLGHHPGAGRGPSEGFPQGALLRTGELRKERLQDRVDLRLQGGAGSGSEGRGKRFRPRPRGLRRAAHRGGAHSRRPSRSLPGLPKGFTGVEWERYWLERYGALVAATPYDDSRRAWSKTDRRWASFARQAPNHRRGDLPAEGLLRPGAPPRQDPRRAAGAPGGQSGGIHLWTTDQRYPRSN